MTTRLGHLVEQVTTVSATGPLPFVALEHLVGGSGGLLPEGGLAEVVGVPSGMVEFAPGDVLFGKLRPYLAKSWLANRAGLCSTELIVMRPRREAAESRWLGYLVQSRVFIDWAIATSEGVKMPRTAWEKLRLLEVAAPALGRQRAIADYLDPETARIDRLVANRRQLSEAISERPWALFVALVVAAKADGVPLRRALVSITDGPFGSAFASDDYADAGAFVVRLGNIGFAEFRYEPAAFLPLDLYERFPRCGVHAGDLLVAGLGDEKNHAGRACVAPDLGPAMVKGKCFCAGVNSGLAKPEYLALYLSSSLGVEEIASASHGSTRAMINLDIVKSMRVHLPSLKRQEEIVQAVRRQRTRVDGVLSAIGHEIDLHLERRQALITAAVTGQIEIPGVAA